MYLSFYYHRENQRRDAFEHVEEEENVDGKGVVAVEVPTNLHDLAPGFRYYT